MNDTERALRIDANPPDGRATRVRVDMEMSTTAAVHARGALEKTIARLEELGGLPFSWPLYVAVEAFERALEAADEERS